MYNGWQCFSLSSVNGDNQERILLHACLHRREDARRRGESKKTNSEKPRQASEQVLLFILSIHQCGSFEESVHHVSVSASLTVKTARAGRRPVFIYYTPVLADCPLSEGHSSSCVFSLRFSWQTVSRRFSSRGGLAVVSPSVPTVTMSAFACLVEWSQAPGGPAFDARVFGVIICFS